MMNRRETFLHSCHGAHLPAALICAALVVPGSPLRATDYFIDKDTGHDTNNDGRMSIPIDQAVAVNWDESENTITAQSGEPFASYVTNTWRDGDVIYLSNGSTIAGHYAIASITSSTVLVMVDDSSGRPSETDETGLTFGGFDGPWKTINRATNDTNGVGPGDRVFIRKGATAYSDDDGSGGAVMVLRTEGTLESGIHFRGWDTDYLTDKAYVILDANTPNLADVVNTDEPTNGSDWYVTLENIHAKCDNTAGTNGFNFEEQRCVQFIHCQAEDAQVDGTDDGYGIITDRDCAIIHGEFHGNERNTVGQRCLVLASKFFDNDETGLNVNGWSTVKSCLFYDNGGTTGSQLRSNAASDGMTVIFNTIDGNDSAVGILIDDGNVGTVPSRANYFNNLITNCTTGIETEWTNVAVRNHIYSDHNWFYSNGTSSDDNYDDYWPAGLHDVTGDNDPEYADPSNGDFQPENECVGVMGFGLNALLGYTSPMHVGALPPVDLPTGDCP